MNELLARNSRWQRWLVWGLLGGLLVVGSALVRSYGMPYDTSQSRLIGMTSLRYVAEKIAPALVPPPALGETYVPLPEFVDRDYGVGFELPVSLAERVLGLSGPRSIYFFRHQCVFFVSWLGVLALYGLGKRRYGGDWRTGLAAAGLLVLSPRLFGEFFYNDKDAVFMALSTVATYTTVRLVERPTWRWAVLHALACALAIDVRLMAVLWPVATLFLLVWRAVQGEYRAAGSWRVLAPVALYCGLLSALVVLFWPYLWERPWDNFSRAFENMQHFRWNGLVLYRGSLVPSTDLPWNYVLKWVGITTPLLQLGLLLLGLGVVAWQVLRRGWRLYAPGTREWQDLLPLGLGLGPVVAVIVFQSVLYDGWRQMYFIYPSLLLLALRGLVAGARWLRARPRPRWQGTLAQAVVLVGLLSSAGQLVWRHPLQSLYFNELAGVNVTSRYEQDYWGIAYLVGLKWVLAHDNRPLIKVCTEEHMLAPLLTNYQVLPTSLRDRLHIVVNRQEADYFLANYRGHPEPFGLPNEVHEVMSGKQRVMSIFKMTW